MACPACGADHDETYVDHRKVVQVMAKTIRERLPLIRSRRGKTGYKGDVELYDPAAPDLPLVQDDEEVDNDEPRSKRSQPTKRRAPRENK